MFKRLLWLCEFIGSKRKEPACLSLEYTELQRNHIGCVSWRSNLKLKAVEQDSQGHTLGIVLCYFPVIITVGHQIKLPDEGLASGYRIWP